VLAFSCGLSEHSGRFPLEPTDQLNDDPDMSCLIQLVRHGQVHSDWQGRIYGCLDVPLSENGEAEARRAAGFLKSAPLCAVVSTGLRRSAYGAEQIAKLRELEVRTESDLREIERGEWAKLSFAELEERFPGELALWNEDPWERRPLGGESLGELSLRVVAVMDRLAAEFEGKEIAVVAHRHVLRCAMAAAIGRKESLSQIIPTGMVLKLDWPAGKKPTMLSAEAFESTDN
jgi:broad specificity phosphatase PhoE